MQNRDYLKDQIEQMAKVLGNMLADLINSKKTGNVNQQIKLTEEKLINQLDLDFTILIELDSEAFLNFIKNNSYCADLESLADIMFEIGKVKSINDYATKSLLIYKHIMSNSLTYSFQWDSKIHEINNFLENNKSL